MTNDAAKRVICIIQLIKNMTKGIISTSGAMNWLGLFTSFSTLMCCALPSLFVLLGMGAMFASLVSAFPQIKWFGQHSTLLFSAAGIMLFANGVLLFAGRNKPCAIGEKAKTCSSSRKASKSIFIFSVAAYVIALLAKFYYEFL